MRIAIALLAGCAGLTPAVEHAHERVRADHHGWTRGTARRVEHLGKGCYLVDERIGYGCISDPRNHHELTCMPTNTHQSTGVTYCRGRPMLWEGVDCYDLRAPTHCSELAHRHDVRHGRGTCTVRLRSTGNHELDQPFELNSDAMLEVSHSLGRGWNGVGPLTFISQHCARAERVRSTGIHTLDDRLRAVLSPIPGRYACGITTTHVIGLDNCVL